MGSAAAALPADHRAGQGAGDAVYDLDAGDHEPAQFVQTGRLRLGDAVVGPWRMRRPLRLRVSRPGRARQALPPGSTVGARCGSGLAVPACLVGWSEPGDQARGGEAS